MVKNRKRFQSEKEKIFEKNEKKKKNEITNENRNVTTKKRKLYKIKNTISGIRMKIRLIN